jgi:hypothetical protein
MLGGATRAFEQSTKWAQTRFQFQRPLADFELVQAKIARMAAYCYAMDAMLYATTGMLDRHDEDIMLETAICKVFCSEMGWRCVNDAMQIMGGEGYMTENEVERIFRDSRINLIVEGANEVMQSFIFAYGGKQLAERMLGIKQAVGWDADESAGKNLGRIYRALKKPEVRKAARSLGSELYFNRMPRAPEINHVDASLRPQAERLGQLVAEFSHQFKLAGKHYEEQIITRQAVQARLADAAMWLHAWACTLSKLDRDVRTWNGHASADPRAARDRAAAVYFMETAELEARRCFHELFHNADESMLAAANAALAFSDTLPNEKYAIHEASPNAKGTGRPPRRDGIKQFPGDGHRVAQPAAVEEPIRPEA